MDQAFLDSLRKDMDIARKAEQDAWAKYEWCPDVWYEAAQAFVQTRMNLHSFEKGMKELV